MAFKINDLMICVLPSPKEVGFNGETVCQPPTRPAGEVVDTSAADLAILKLQLAQQLAEIDAQQAAGLKSLLPKSVKQVDMLTVKLDGALKQLKTRRAQLSKKSKQPAKKK